MTSHLLERLSKRQKIKCFLGCGEKKSYAEILVEMEIDRATTKIYGGYLKSSKLPYDPAVSL